MSAVVSGRSAWLVVGASGMAFVHGVAAVWAIPGYVLVELFLFFTVAPRLRERTGAKDDLTIADFLASSFPTRARALRITSMLLIVGFFTVYVAAQFEAGGKVMTSAFPSLGLDHAGFVLLTAGIVLVYTVVGGFLAVSVTDVVQAGLMLLSLVVLPVIVIVELGGVDAMARALESQDPALLDPGAKGGVWILSLLAIGLGSIGNPHILVRYMSIRDPRELRRAAVVGTVWNVLMGWGAIFAGLAGRAALGGVEALPGADSENLFPHLAATRLPPWLFGLAISSVFAAIMSTADSQLLVASSAVVRDGLQGVLGRGAKLSPGRAVLVGRLTTATLVALSLLLLALTRDVVFWFVLFAWGGLGAAFGVAVLGALYGRGRVTGEGVLAGMWTGALTVGVWKQFGFDRSLVYELVPAFPLALVAMVLVSRITRRRGAAGS